MCIDDYFTMTVNDILFSNDNSFRDIRDIILTMEFPPDNDPEEILEKLERIFPAEDTMKSFREYLDQDRFDLQDVERFGVAESIWFYSRTIPMVKERCSLWKFQIDFQERCSKIWDVINLIRTTCRDIAGNEKMYRFVATSSVGKLVSRLLLTCNHDALLCNFCV